MHAQVVRVELQPGKIDEAISVFLDSILPAVRDQKGFVSARLLADREDSRVIGTTLWETEADVEAIATSGFFQEQVAKMASIVSGPPEREVYEVVVES